MGAMGIPGEPSPPSHRKRDKGCSYADDACRGECRSGPRPRRTIRRHPARRPRGADLPGFPLSGERPATVALPGKPIAPMGRSYERVSAPALPGPQ